MTTNLRTFQVHDKGDLLLKFQFEPSSLDTDLASKFGDPDIEVGATIFTAATATATRSSGVITAAPVTFIGDIGTYSSFVPVVVTAVDPTGSGSGATFTAVLNGSGQITSITVTAGGTNYGTGTTISITGDHVTVYPAQKVKLFSGFPYTRRVNNIQPGDSSLATLATNYTSLIQTRVTSALTTLRSLGTAHDLSKETVTQP